MDWKSHDVQAAWRMKISPTEKKGLIKDLTVDTFQVRSVSTCRCVSPEIERFLRKFDGPVAFRRMGGRDIRAE